ncbi:MAG: hypothetical protein HPY30_15315 [Gammaproteobacteria bacterium (ex Lamellibrachia satsuma)]|nr:MAG: hypothetical protein HPY30_15315 [Gammaproteobacteria bacterium (ex Lamellibrachia satsuma)]
MNNKMRKGKTGVFNFAIALSMLAVSAAHSGQVTLNVQDPSGAPVNGFRWLIQEDTTYAVTPDVSTGDMLSLGFHRSNHPPAINSVTGAGLSGYSDTAQAVVADVEDNKNYYISVLPFSGYSLSGGSVAIDATGTDQQTVTVTVQQQPIPTAQISFYLFHDHYPVNGNPDLPQEINPPVGNAGHVDWSGFSLFLEEPAGKYGHNGGQVIQDAFANPLGTTYDRTCDINGNPDLNPLTNFVCMTAGAPVVATLGDGTLHPDQDGFLTVKNLAPGKYGTIMIPPTGSNWQQTTTIEGTKVIDAWVKANEPPVFVEFGLPGPHVFVGFTKASSEYVAGQAGGFPPLQPPLPGEQTANILGKVTDQHMSRPPNFTFFSGRDFPACWVALNSMVNGALGKGLYAAPCAADSTFSIPNLAPGSYQLAIWDANLTVVFAQTAFSVDTTGGTCNGGLSCDFGDVSVFNWFGRLNTAVFSDTDQDGFWDPTEAGIGPESQDVTIRWRDGTVYQNFATDNGGEAPFDTVFPFFHWLVAEASFANKKATGATFVVDAGGPVLPDNGWTYPSFDQLTPQTQCAAGVSYDPVTGTCPAGSEENNPNTGNNLSRTETGVVLTQAFQQFLGQTSVMQFGKADYKTFEFPSIANGFTTTFVGENGGISGMVHYAITRAEDDPRFTAVETWEPGIPRVQLNLYADGDIDCFPLNNFPADSCDIDWDGDGVFDADDNLIDDVNMNGLVDLADADNYPQGNFPGPEDIDRNGNSTFDLGDALNVGYSDSWDDSLPTGCQGESFTFFTDPADPATGTTPDCYDGLRNFNQIRPGVFDGGWAFEGYDRVSLPVAIQTKLSAFYATPAVASVGFEGMLPGDYIVEANTPAGYKIVKEEDRNVDFGEVFVPSAQALAVTCVGDDHQVPPHFSMLTKDGSGDTAMLIDPAVNDPAPFAGTTRPLCDRKKIALSSGQNAATEFHLYTDVPIAANVTGMILNDLANEFDPNSPTFGEKFAPPWTPVAFYDWNGVQVSRVYADQFGRYDTVVPSTFSANLPQPSGMSPNMLVACMNDAGPVSNPLIGTVDVSGDITGVPGQIITAGDVPAEVIDPFFDSQYSQFCYTFQYMPGSTTYLDTPVLPVAAFAGPGKFPLDCKSPDFTPTIASVRRHLGDGGGGPFALANQTIIIKSMGKMLVPNPDWDGTGNIPKNIERDYRFGAGQGRVFLEDDAGIRTELTVGLWRQNRIEADVTATDPLVAIPHGAYQVVVVGMDGTESPIGVSLTVGIEEGWGARNNWTLGKWTDAGTNYTKRLKYAYEVRSVDPLAVAGPLVHNTIQDAIDAANLGDLILVTPGVYDEMVMMWKPVKLQGWGAGDVAINARQVPTEKIIDWRTRAKALVDNGFIDPLPGQIVANVPFAALAENIFPTSEGAGIFVAGLASSATCLEDTDRLAFCHNRNKGSRVDGFTIVGASSGGSIVVNGNASFMDVSNNRITANSGFFGGGIRIGHPQLSHEIVSVNDPAYTGLANADIGDFVYDDAHNDDIRVHHNQISTNGGFGGAGGGVSLNTGADNYRVQKNWICGNFTQGDGGGIAHLGFSENGLIEDNDILFNESFAQAGPRTGGGIAILGQAALVPETFTGELLTPGTGNVTVDSNRIRGNLAGAGDGGGISLALVNGHDVARFPDRKGKWSQVRIYNNMIANNVAGAAGGGISLQDVLKADIRANTVANNDSTATAAILTFAPGNVNESIPMPAGIVSRTHSAELSNVMSGHVDPLVLPGGATSDWITFSDAKLKNNIVHHNRSFYWLNQDPVATPLTNFGIFPASCADPVAGGAGCDVANVDLYSVDLGVLDGLVTSLDLQLEPKNSLLTDTAGYATTNVMGDPAFVMGYVNIARDQTLVFQERTVLQTAGAFDEGGNWLQVSYGPLTISAGDYHVTPASVGIDNGANVPLQLELDFDNEPRPDGGNNDIGADELQ